MPGSLQLRIDRESVARKAFTSILSGFATNCEFLKQHCIDKGRGGRHRRTQDRTPADEFLTRCARFRSWRPFGTTTSNALAGLQQTKRPRLLLAVGVGIRVFVFGYRLWKAFRNDYLGILKI